jgi:hypothetical protein
MWQGLKASGERRIICDLRFLNVVPVCFRARQFRRGGSRSRRGRKRDVEARPVRARDGGTPRILSLINEALKIEFFSLKSSKYKHN